MKYLLSEHSRFLHKHLHKQRTLRLKQGRKAKLRVLRRSIANGNKYPLSRYDNNYTTIFQIAQSYQKSHCILEIFLIRITCFKNLIIRFFLFIFRKSIIGAF